ncbi:MAG: aminoacyl-tRNA hydrolase [Ruminococcaceae bacterium]|nr:aminoacyl-tRNA hydrolase [Oscillospiraceae bacterium]
MSDIFALFKKIEKKNDAPSAPITHLIVGLGNPGDKYFHTRHNAGYLMMDYLSQRCSTQVNKLKFKSLVGEATIAGKRCLLMKPQTFMNASGEAVQQATAFYKIPMENVLVFSDDTALNIGRVRVRKKGSDGGQKGLRSIITLMNTDEFPRIRFGVGQKPHPDYDLGDWVLSEFNKEEQKALFSAFEKAYDGVVKVLEGDFDGAMQLCNGK